MKKKIVVVCSVILLASIIQTVFWFFIDLHFYRGCGSWLKLAADANSTKLASERLDRAIQYLEQNNLTEGSTSIFFKVPSNDLAIWYKNLKEAQNNLHNFPSNATEADINTNLVKLRETLLDHTSHGDDITLPENIIFYPHQTVFVISYMILAVLALTAFIILVIIGVTSLDN